MKNPSNVGADFDQYVLRWRKENYPLEVGHSIAGVAVDDSRSDQVQRPGDEWGDVGPLRDAYRSLIQRFGPAEGPINVVEIGAGGGRSTAVMLEVLADRSAAYHIVDVSAGFMEVLQERIDHPVDIHIVDDVDLGELPADHFDICLAQSSWSHISLYDQYRYLRALRRVLRPNGVVFVSGQFLLGLGHDWTWNRFVRRVHQIDRGAEGVYHEFTSVSALAEMLDRLGYETCCINTAGFVARRGAKQPDEGVVPRPGPISFPFNPSSHDFLRIGKAQTVSLPTAVPTSPSNVTAAAHGAGNRGASRRTTTLRGIAKRLPGLRPAVMRARKMRRRLNRRPPASHI